MKFTGLPAVVVVLVALFVAAGPAQSPVPGPNSLLFEDFSGGIPSTWTVVDGFSDGITWGVVDPAVYHLPLPFTNPSAVVDSNRYGGTFIDEHLVSPVVDASACTAPVDMTFANVFRYYSGQQAEIADVDVSADGGTNWSNLVRMSQANFGPESRTLTLAGYPRTSSRIAARFHYYNARGDYWWLVDDVNVTCRCTGDVTAPATTATPAGGKYETTQAVGLACVDVGCGCRAIHFTTDGSDPTDASPTYTGPISVAPGTTLKFFAVDYAGNAETTKTEAYLLPDRVPPVANAGAAQTVHVGVPVTLDGSASSDPDSMYPLSYAWTMISRPAASQAPLTDADLVNPTFVPDVTGDYQIQLTVTDATGLASAPSSVRISTTNSAPTAEAGQPQRVSLNELVTLSGSGTDPNGDAITGYSWTLTAVPDASHVVLSGAGTATPSFRPDAPGDYVASLVVTDRWGLPSAPATITITTDNLLPVAEAEAAPQAVVLLGSTVTLDGSQSYDPDGDPITYAWAFKTPAPGGATISGASTPHASFEAGAYGDFLVELKVTDAWGGSGSTTVNVSFRNLPPVANAGDNQSVQAGSLVSLDGSASSDPNGDALTYHWSIVVKPTPSGATLTGETTATPMFTADVPGFYSVQLIADDGLLTSTPKTVSVTATQAPSDALQKLAEALAAVNALDTSVFKNKNMKTTLTTKLNVVIDLVRRQQTAEAIDKLQNDVLAKLDGCGAQPDGNDWIIRCSAQWAVRPSLEAALAALRGW